MFGCVAVSTEGGDSYSPGPRGSQRHPVSAEVHPGSKSVHFVHFVFNTKPIHLFYLVVVCFKSSYLLEVDMSLNNFSGVLLIHLGV